MAKNIQLNLTINGVKQNITNINELEKAIKGAEEELKNIEIGSDKFKTLSSQVKQAKGVFEDFQESIKGQELEKRVGAFAKVGEGITASFAGAQAAISLFGTESEAVAEAAAKAQSLLTIALAARSAAEGVVAVRTVAANIATYASAAAAGAATTATRVLYATLAANPYGAILAVIGLVVGALYALSSASKEQVNVQKELSQATSQEADSLKNSLFILTQMNGARNLQKQEIEKLKKDYPGFNAFIDKENKLNEAGVRFLKLKIKQYELEAQAKLITQKIAENGIKILEIENQGILENVSFWESAWNVIKAGGNVSSAMIADFKTGLENQKKAVAEINKENEKWRGSLVKVYQETDQVLGQLETYNKTMTNQVQIDEKSAQAKEDLKKKQEEMDAAYKKGYSTLIQLADAVKKLDEDFKKYNDTIEKVSKIDYEAPILKQLEDIKEARKTAAKELSDSANDVKEAFKSLGVDGLPTDELIKTFEDLRARLEFEFTLIDQGVAGNFNAIYEEFITRNGKLNQAQKNILSELIQSYQQVSRFVLENDFKDFIQNLKGVNVAWDDFRGGTDRAFDAGAAFLQIIGDITAANKTFINEFVEKGDQFLIEPIQFDPKKVELNSKAYLSQLEKSLFKPLGIRLIKEQIDYEKKLLEISQGDVAKAEVQGRIDALTKQLETFVKTGQVVGQTTAVTTEVINAQSKKVVDQFVKIVSAVVTAEQKIIGVNKEVQKLTETLTKNPEELSKAIGGTVLANIDAISTLLIGVRTKEQKIEKDFVDKLKNDRKGLEKFKQDLIKQGINVEKASYDDLLAAYIAYKKKEKEVDDKANQDKKKSRKETTDNILRGIQEFSNVLNQISSLASERIRTDVESLQIAQKKALENVVGDSETAAQKRIEIQTEYEQKIKEIEKKGRIQSLQFSLVQTIANGAQAIIKALAELGPIAGPILAGVNAAITAAQIGIITDQINNAQMMRRGGMLKAQGGMLLSGPSHEGGGIPLAQYGVVAEGQEAIINRQSSINFRDLLSTINQSGGGRPLVVNNFDDSRIVEAIASQKQKPLRAYVLGSEITNEQAISKRLDDLSKI